MVSSKCKLTVDALCPMPGSTVRNAAPRSVAARRLATALANPSSALCEWMLRGWRCTALRHAAPRLLLSNARACRNGCLATRQGSSGGNLRLCHHRRRLGRQRVGQSPERGWHGNRPCSRGGPSDWHPFIHLPAGFMKTFHDRRVNWLYSMEPSEWTGGRRILAPRGKTLGGSSSINGHVYNRGQRMDFDTWAQLGNRGWGYADVLPYFKRMERRLSDGQADPTFRGRDGALTVTDIDWVPSPVRGLHRGRRQHRHPAQPRLQRHHPGRHRLRPAHHPQGPQGQRGHRLPASRPQARERHGAHARARHRSCCWRTSAPSASPTTSAGAAANA